MTNDQINQRGPGSSLEFTLPYQPPFLWDRLLEFWAGRAILGVEVVSQGRYARTVRLETGEGQVLTGWFSLENDPAHDRVRVWASPSLQGQQAFLEARVRHMFDLGSDPLAIAQKLESMNEIQEGLFFAGTRVPGSYDPFEMAVRAILGQQITVKAAQTLAGRLASQLGHPVQTPVPGLTHSFPSPSQVMALGPGIADYLGPLGVTGRRSQTIGALAALIQSGEMDFLSDSDIHAKMKRLMDIPGIGPWTAHYMAMRAMRWSDAFPGSDYGVKKVLAPRSQKEIHELAEAWRPWRAYAVAGIWNSR